MGYPQRPDLVPATPGGFYGELEAALRRADVTPDRGERSAAQTTEDYAEAQADESRAAAEAQAEAQTQAQAEADAQTRAQTDSQTKAHSQTQAETESRPRASDRAEADRAEAKGKAPSAKDSADDAGATEKAQAKTEGPESDDESAASNFSSDEGSKRARMLRTQSQDFGTSASAAQSADGTIAAKDAKTKPGLKARAPQAASEMPVAEPASGKGSASAGAGREVATAPGKAERAGEAVLRELPRAAADGGENRIVNGKGERQSSQETEGSKESGKNGIRATVISRGRSGGETGNASSGNHREGGPGGGDASLTAQQGIRPAAETTQQEGLVFEGMRGDAAHLEGLRASMPSASRLEGGQDLMPRHLNQQLRDFATGDVVRHARFVLRENAGGEIRLLLKPQQLGTVRVRLDVQDNRIAGRIIVENTTVRDAFEQTLPELQRAFREAGLETGSLEVTVGEDGQASREGLPSEGRRRRAIEELDNSVPIIIGELDEPRIVNVYA